MKSKIIKIGFLLIFSFFSSFFIGCYETENLLVYSIKRVEIKTITREKNELGVMINIFSAFERTERVGIYDPLSTCNSVYATGVRTVGYKLDVGNKIKNFVVRILPNNKYVTSLLKTKTNKSISDFIAKINNNKLTPIQNSEGNVTKAKESDIFYFKEEPLFLKGKDVQIEFSIETEDGKTFADTTKVINMEW